MDCGIWVSSSGSVWLEKRRIDRATNGDIYMGRITVMERMWRISVIPITFSSTTTGIRVHFQCQGQELNYFKAIYSIRLRLILLVLPNINCFKFKINTSADSHPIHLSVRNRFTTNSVIPQSIQAIDWKSSFTSGDHHTITGSGNSNNENKIAANLFVSARDDFVKLSRVYFSL